MLPGLSSYINDVSDEPTNSYLNYKGTEKNKIEPYIQSCFFK